MMNTPDPILDLILAILGVDHALDRMSKRMLRQIGVTVPQRMAVRLIASRPEVSAGDLARALDIDPSTLTGILARLEEGGFIKRHSDPLDRRSWRFTVTGQGRRIDRLRSGTVEASVRDVANTMDPADIRRMRVALHAIKEALSRTEPPRKRWNGFENPEDSPARSASSK